MAKSDFYPEINIPQPKTPDKLWAIPVLGILLKIILLIPVFIEIAVLSWITMILSMVNSFVVLFTGEYMPTSYNLNMGLFRLVSKMTFYLLGVTDKYPGFNLEINEGWKVEMGMIKNPNRLFAIPVFGGMVRIVTIIPFAIFAGVIRSAASIGMLGSWVPVLSSGKYPESIYELGLDATRTNIASYAWLLGMSDKYPSFNISWNHKNTKIALIIVAVIFTIVGWVNNSNDQKKQFKQHPGINYETIRNEANPYR